MQGAGSRSAVRAKCQEATMMQHFHLIAPAIAMTVYATLLATLLAG